MNYNIGIIGLNHKTSTLETREAVSFSLSRVEEALNKLKTLYPSNEYVILSTCNRVEIYIGSMNEIIFDDVINFISSYHNVAKENIIPFIYIYQGYEAITHLFEVGAGVDSLVVGETQILGQMKKSYQRALQSGATGKVLNMAFQKAFTVGKKIRTTTKIAEGNVSVSSISCQLACEVLKGLSEKKVLLIGAGKIGALMLKSLHERGADTVLVSSRNYEKAENLAREFNGSAIKFGEIEDFMVKTDIVISATSAPHYILRLDMLKKIMQKRKDRPLFLIDLAVPRDIDPIIGTLSGVHLYNIDSLKSIANQNLKKREKEISRCKEIITKETAHFMVQRNLGLLLEEEDDKLLKTIMSRRKPSFSPSLQKDRSPCYSVESYIEM